MLLFLPAPARTFPAWVRYGLAGLLLVGAAALAGLLLAPSGVTYEVAGGQFLVHGHAGVWPEERSIALADVRDAAELTVSAGRRTAGTGLPGYCSGSWTFRAGGEPEPFQVATTCGADVVRIDVAGARSWLVSPADPAALLAALRSGEATRLPARPGAASPVWWPVFWLSVLALLSVPLALIGVYWKIWYRVGEGVLELPTLLGTRRYAMAGARAAAVLRPRVALRVAGAALPGYYAGWFWMWGKLTRVWATRMDAGVRIDRADGGCIFVTPADVPAFLAALSAAGVRVGEEPGPAAR